MRPGVIGGGYIRKSKIVTVVARGRLLVNYVKAVLNNIGGVISRERATTLLYL